MKLIYLLALVVMTTVANVVSVENVKIPKCSLWHLMGRIPDETDCTRYYQCIFAIPRLTICPIISDKQTYFNPTLEMCLWSETSPCESQNTNPTPGTGTSTNSSSSTEPTTTTKSYKERCEEVVALDDNSPKPTECVEPCKTPIKDDCRSYFTWNDDKRTTIKCGEGMVYNGLTTQCDLTMACPPCPATKSPF